MKSIFNTFEDFIREYSIYHYDKCDVCDGIRELQCDDVTICIEDRLLHFPQLLVLECTNCKRKCFPEYTKQIIYELYKTMLDQNQYNGEFLAKGYSKRFDYCQQQNYIYDHKDYYNIPGLCHDEEHYIEGFLTPVYFEKNALIYFITLPDYEVDIYSESYGTIKKKDPSGCYLYEWNIPFGFNSNNKLVFWLGDLSCVDSQSQNILRSFNIESDHLLIASEFYQGQIGCMFSEPIREAQIIANKNEFIKNIKGNYSIDISHLNDECDMYAKNLSRPIVFTEDSISNVVNSFHKILIEGFNVGNLRKVYEKLYAESERPSNYRDWQSIRLIKEILKKQIAHSGLTIDIELIISPLYILNDLRIYLDHLLPNSEREKKKKHIETTLGGISFLDLEKLYFEEINRLNKLFQYLIILSK